MMPTHTLELLELPEVRRRVAGRAVFTRSQELARELTPATDPAVVRARLARTSEARRLLTLVPTFGVGSAHDVGSVVAMAARGFRLDAPAFLALHDQLRAVQRVRQSLAKVQDETPDLWSIAGPLEPLTALRERIGLTVDESGAVLDTASDGLAQIRGKLRRARTQVERLMQRLVSSPETQRLLQEPLVTERNGRLVVPVRVESKSAFPGIVHDASASGQTLFMEPLAAVEPNNEVRVLQAAEQHEIERVLLELAGLIGAQASPIVAGVEGLAALDLALAMARCAEDQQAVAPVVSAGDGFDLRAARHPLLSAPVVPIDVAVQPDAADGYRALVISGPNTGGKTVALKTIGLLHLMAACGLHIPAQDGSRVAVYAQILADIGDEQSIAQSLSTFAAHLRRLVAMVQAAGPRTLALADELGAGTDPAEGAALAQAILDRLLAAGAVCVVTSHHPELKTFAYQHPLARNASVEFDVETLRPTYRLIVGVPGKSNALAIAERLGLDPGVIAEAQRRLTREHHDTEALIAALHAERQAAERARAEAQAQAREATEARARLEAELAGIEVERAAVLRVARREARALLREARQALQQATAAGHRAGRRQPDQAREQVARVEAHLAPADSAPAELPDAPAPPTVDVGDRVHVAELAREGRVVSVDRDALEVAVGQVRTRVARRSVTRLGGPPAAPQRQPLRAHVPASPPLQIDIRGKRVAEIIELVDLGLSQAVVAGAPALRIIHGKGTGALRQAVREYLQAHPVVHSLSDAPPNEGGDGISVVRLAGSTSGKQ